MNSYDLSRVWFDFCFENPEKISPNHTAIYFFAIEHCNRLGWKEKFGFPTQMVMDAVGIKKHQTYIRYFNELVEWGFLKLVQKSANQYSSNIISLIVALPKKGKPLGKAILTHAAKQTETIWQSTGQSNSSIDKPDNIEPDNHKPKTIYQLAVDFWLKEFHVGWTYTATQGKQLKDLLAKLKQIIPEASDHDLILAFKSFCLNLPDWFKDKDLQVLNSKFNEIVTQQIKNQNNGSTKKSRFNNL